MNIKDFKVGDEVIPIITERDTDRFSAEDYFPNGFPYGLVEVVNVGSPESLFKSIEDYNNYIEWKKLLRYITLYKFNRLSLEQLRAIKEIIEDNKEE